MLPSLGRPDVLGALSRAMLGLGPAEPWQNFLLPWRLSKFFALLQLTCQFLQANVFFMLLARVYHVQ